MAENKNTKAPEEREDIILAPEEAAEEAIEQIVTLYDENGNPEDYELIDLFEYQEGVYGAFTPVLTGEEKLTAYEEIMLENYRIIYEAVK